MTDRYPYRHHGPAVHGSKLADYLISEANMTEDLEQLRAENALLPCPFCGGSSLAVRETYKPLKRLEVFCRGNSTRACDAAMWGENIDRAICEWNTRAAISADPAPVVDAWHPIETAPRDGTWFWVLDDCDAISVRWHDTFQAFVASWREMTFAESYGGEVRLHSPDILTPTHWMPRPKPPAGENGND